MTTLAWLLFSGLLLGFISLIGSIAILMNREVLDRIQLPLVAFAAGSLIGGALFHMIPAAVSEMNDSFALYVWLASGFMSFFALEQFLNWQRCQSHSPTKVKPLTYLLLLADSFHNFLDGILVAASFLTDVQLGIVAWVATAAHEVPQKLGDIAVLLEGGWSKTQALTYNTLSALTLIAGGLLAYVVSAKLEVTFLIPFAAGNFLYIGAADLIPEIKVGHDAKTNLIHFFAFAFGIAWLLALRFIFP